MLKGVRIETESEEVSVDIERSKKYKALDIVDESVKFLPPSLLNNFKEIEVFQVLFSKLSKLNKETFDSINKLEDVSFEGNELTEIPADTFNDLTNLKSLNLARNKIQVINYKTFLKNIQLEVLTLSFNNIAKIHEYTFESLVKLEKLFISNNQIEELRDQTFKSNVALQEIDLNGNKIKFIGKATFDHISKSLQILNLSDNECITTNENFLNSDSSLNFPKLQDELVESCLPYSEQECKKNLEAEKEEKKSIAEAHKAEVLKLEKLKKAHDATSKDLSILKMMFEQVKQRADVSNSRLEECELVKKNVTDKQKQVLDALIKCEASNGSLFVSNDATELRHENENLRNEIEIMKKRFGASGSHNYFEIICYLLSAGICESRGVFVSSENMVLANVSQDLVSCTSLIIVESYVIFIPQDIFAKFRALTLFKISGSNVRNLTQGTFKGAENLKQLDVSKNLIENLPKSAFEGLDKLEELILEDNAITEISAGTFRNLVSLKALSLKRNKIMHLRAPLFNYNVHLLVLQVNHNPITTIDANLLDNCTNLKKVYYGKTTCIEGVAMSSDLSAFKNTVMAKCKV